ncbi:glycosyltransferase family 2 protein [Roseococcus pinisoli]|uniref:Glycosyltransferase family 2 protein n=1 Tax=Roseococcus pinisoli TaxID=2835040 RepID=A0ABS5QF83_9PROT|nr:glycosyltransferase family A protein [Roseococcus pinisoli]MBS7812033.1 glycosyltransferase family 2 protein [Roseococcus pinisoli]
MMASLRISVIIPTFNRAALLRETLRHVLAQTSPAEEVIVVDDGSTDGTAEMVAADFAPQVTVLRIANAGDLAARNHGLSVATGDLVAFCDSDDLWDAGFLAEMRGIWRREPGLRVAYANFRILAETADQKDDKFGDAPPGFWEGMRELGEDQAVFDRPIVDRLVRFQPFFPSCMVADREFLLSIGGWDESVGRVVGTDFATVLLLGEHAPFGVIRRPLVSIRKHEANYSGDVQTMNLGDAAILEHVLARRPTLRPLAREITESIARRRREAFDIAFARHDFEAVLAIDAMLGASGRSASQRVKAMVARWPPPFSGLAAASLLRLGSWRAGTSSAG